MNLTLMLVLMTMHISFINRMGPVGLTMMDMWMFFCLLIPAATVIIQVRVEFVRYQDFLEQNNIIRIYITEKRQI